MSVSLTADATVTGGIALVALDVRNPTPVARQVRVANRLDGPVLPPRRNGVPEPGWDEDGVTAVVDAGDSVALGYACPVGERGAAAPPAELAAVGDPEGSLVDVVTHAQRELGPFRPPRDAVPDGTSLDDGGGSRGEYGSAGSEGESTVTGWGAGEESDTSELPDAVADWLGDVAARVALAERLTDASVADATGALAEGGCDPETLANAVEADVEALRSVGERTGTLISRAEATDVPVGALGRLA